MLTIASRLVGVVLFAGIGIVLSIFGLQLTLLAGSLYYFIAGLTWLIVALLILLRKPAAAWLYCVYLLATIVWALLDGGFDPWALLPRLAMPAILGLWFTLPTVRRDLIRGAAFVRFGVSVPAWPAATLFLLSAAVFGSSLWATRFEPGSGDPTRFSGATGSDGATIAAAPSVGAIDWRVYGNTNAGQRFSRADQIGTTNVGKLELAWSYRYTAGTKAKPGSTFEVTPINVGNSLYLCTADNQIISLDADSGAEQWRYDPKVDTKGVPHVACRGVAYHTAESTNEACAARIFTATVDDRLIAVDAANGHPCESFGNHGAVMLTENLGKVYPGNHYSTSPPLVIGNSVVVGSFVLDNQSNHSAPGVVRAYDALSGKLLWGWDLLSATSKKMLAPQDTFAANTPNAWSILSADEARNLIFVPTGVTPPDYFGGTRPPEYERYSSSIVALDATSGDVRWSFQTTHHDLWDMDVPSEPVLVDLETPAGKQPALIAATKRGEIFVLDRRDGKPIVAVEERPAPQGNVPGERYSPTQPYPVDFPSFGAPTLRESDMWGATMLDQLLCRIDFKRRYYRGQFTPPSLQPALLYPGLTGLIDWGGVSVDPERQIMLVNTSLLPARMQLLSRADIEAAGLVPYGEPKPADSASRSATRGEFAFTGSGLAVYPQAGTPFGAALGPFLSKFGLPCSRPPWGEVAAVDLRARKLLWKRTLGTTRDAAPFGISLATGVFNIGGSLTTRGGVAFIGAAIDDYLRAFSSTTGEMLWQARLPAGAQASPMTYVSGKTGRQYVVIAAGGHLAMRTRSGDYVLAFALPKNEAGAGHAD